MIELSVIIPNYQTEKELFLNCIDSVINGCENEIEIIIVDDGSPKEYRDSVYKDDFFRDKRMKMIFQENGGVSSARNRGIKEARGKYLTFVDADDIIVGTFIRDGLCAAVESGADIVIGGIVDLGRHPDLRNNNQLVPFSVENLKMYEKQNEIIDLFLGCPQRFSDRVGYIGRGPVAKIIRSSLAKQIPFQVGLTIYEDTLWNMNLLKLVNSACVVERIWYGYHNTVQSASKGFHQDEIERSTKGMNAIADTIDLSNKIIRKAFREQCIVEYIRIVNTYFLSAQHTGSMSDIIKESRQMLRSRPWNMVSTYNDLKDFSARMKVYGALYILNAWIPMKRMLGLFRCKYK